MSSIDSLFSVKDLSVFIPVAGGLIGFIIFWFTQESGTIKQKFLNKYGANQGSAKFIMCTKYLGGFTMGVLPALAFIIAFPETSLSQLGMGLRENTFRTIVFWTVGIWVVLIPLTYFSARKPAHLTHYPQIRAKEWDRKMILGNLVSWAFYLLGYEFLFRGVLLFPLVDAIGLWPAIAVNVGMYSATHIPKGLGQTTGAIPLSMILCLVSVQTGSIWTAFFVHLAMAWTNTLTALVHHPEMVIKKRFVK